MKETLPKFLQNNRVKIILRWNFHSRMNDPKDRDLIYVVTYKHQCIDVTLGECFRNWFKIPSTSYINLFEALHQKYKSKSSLKKRFKFEDSL